MKNLKNTSDTDLQEIINQYNSVSAILRALDISETCPYNRKCLKERMKNLDTTVYKQNRIDNNPFSPIISTIIPDELFFTQRDKRISGFAIKNRLIRYKNWDESCSSCGLGTLWNGARLSLHIDHINGDGMDNRIENLRFLCPNCHSQTDTFAGKNIKNREIAKKINICSCGKQIHNKASRCVVCNGKVNQKIAWPSTEIIQEEIWNRSIIEYAKELNVSDNALRKHCKINGIKVPNASYSRNLFLGNKEECERIKKLILSH